MTVEESGGVGKNIPMVRSKHAGGLSRSGREQEAGLKPAIVGPWRQLAPPPDLSRHGLQPEAGTAGVDINQVNDHTIFADAHGAWHLWACVRFTRAGRVLCHWRAGDFHESPWILQPGVIRCDKEYGESLVDYRGEEFLQSPFCLRADGQWYLFYGGYDTGLDRDGRPASTYCRIEKQICLMTSPDGVKWTRHRSAGGLSRLFAGPGAARDPMVGRFNGQWICYYAGHHDQDRDRAGIYARTSADLLHWSDWRLVHYDERLSESGRPIHGESPYVVERAGRYYLFRSQGHLPGTHVFASDDPLDFGLDAAGCDAMRVARLPVIAPELVVLADGREYITTIHDGGRYAISIAPLAWR